MLMPQVDNAYPSRRNPLRCHNIPGGRSQSQRHLGYIAARHLYPTTFHLLHARRERVAPVAWALSPIPHTSWRQSLPVSLKSLYSFRWCPNRILPYRAWLPSSYLSYEYQSHCLVSQPFLATREYAPLVAPEFGDATYLPPVEGHSPVGTSPSSNHEPSCVGHHPNPTSADHHPHRDTKGIRGALVHQSDQCLDTQQDIQRTTRNRPHRPNSHHIRHLYRPVLHFRPPARQRSSSQISFDGCYEKQIVPATDYIAVSAHGAGPFLHRPNNP